MTISTDNVGKMWRGFKLTFCFEDGGYHKDLYYLYYVKYLKFADVMSQVFSTSQQQHKNKTYSMTSMS